MASSLDCSNCMARATKSGGELAKSPPALAGSSFIGWFFRPAMLFRMSLVAGVCALWPYAAQRLPSLGARPEYRIPFSQIEISPPPERPVPMNLVEQVAEQADLPRELSVLSESLASEVADAFRRHPWVSKVIRVRKSFPSAITVELEYRQPVAMAQVPGGRVPIDIHGVILPSADFSPIDTNRFPVIRAVDSKPHARPGNVWNDPSILAAARLASLLGGKWKSLKLEAISVPRITDSSIDPNDVVLELIGQGGSRIVWGRAPGSDHPGELEASQKIRRVEKYLADYGDYGLPNGPYEIDIRHWQEISRRPLVSEVVQTKPTKSQKPDFKNQNDSAGMKPREAKNQKSEKRR